MEHLAKIDQVRHHVIHHIESAHKVIKKINANMDNLQFSLDISDVDLLYIRTNIEMYQHNLQNIGELYSHKKKLDSEQALELLHEQKAIIDFLLHRLKTGIKVEKGSETLIRGGFLMNQNHDSVTNLWKLLLMYDERIRALLNKARHIPGMTAKDMQDLISTPEVKNYFRTISVVIQDNGEKLLTKEYHVEDAISRRWEKLKLHIEQLTELVQQQIIIVKKHKKGVKPMPKLFRIHAKEKSLVTKILQEDDILKDLKSTAISSYFDDVKRFENELGMKSGV